jgi:hypothetical protein
MWAKSWKSFVEELKMGTSFSKLQKILRCPEYLLFLSALPEK